MFTGEKFISELILFNSSFIAVKASLRVNERIMSRGRALPYISLICMCAIPKRTDFTPFRSENRYSPHVRESGFSNMGNFCLLMESGIYEISACGICFTVQAMRNPANDWNPKSKYHWQRIRNPGHRIQKPRLFWIPLLGATSIHFAHFGLESGMAFEGTTGVYERICLFYSKWIRKRELWKKMKMVFKKSFCWRSNLSNDDKISAYENMSVAFCDLLHVRKQV